MKENQELKEQRSILEESTNKLQSSLQSTTEKLKTTEMKLHKSSENVDELVGAVRERAEEVTAKEEQIMALEMRLENEMENKKQMEKNISHVRDENAQIKNRLKVKEQNTDSSHVVQVKPDFIKDYEDFKKFISKKIADISDQIRQPKITTQPTTSTDSISTDKHNKNLQRSVAKTHSNRKRKLTKPQLNNTDYNTVQRTILEESYESVSTSSLSDDESLKVYHESNPHIPIRPGTHKSYSHAVEERLAKLRGSVKDVSKRPVQGKTLIVSTSMTRHVKPELFNAAYEKGVAEFQRYHGGKARNIKEDIAKNLNHGTYDRAVVHIGGNDLQDGYHPSLLRKLANNIIETGKICKERGASDVFIAGVTIRKYEYTWDRCKLLNWELRELCLINGFTFIDNSNISLSHLCDDVHLNDPGTTVLANNYLNSLNRKSVKKP